MKTARKTALLLAGILLAYLLVAAAWAWASVHDAIGAAPAGEAAALTPRQAAILLAVEDPTFYVHPGLSIAPGQGMATITGAVTRDLLLFDTRPDGVRGALQSLYRAAYTCCKRVDFGRDTMALVVDANMPKAAQLDYYTAHIYMGTNDGRPVRGLAQAARVYLGKPLAAATESEFVRLVAMIKAPDQYHPLKNPAALALRSRRIEALVQGRCTPAGWLDTTYAGCDGR